MSIRVITTEFCSSVPIGSNGNGQVNYEWICNIGTLTVTDWNIYIKDLYKSYKIGDPQPTGFIQELTIASLVQIYPQYDSFQIKLVFENQNPGVNWLTAKYKGVSMSMNGTENSIPNESDNINYTFNSIESLPVGTYRMKVKVLAYGIKNGVSTFLINESDLDLTKGSINLTVSTEDVPPDYGLGNLKYYFENETYNGDIFRTEIYKRNWGGQAIQVNGRTIHTYQGKKDLHDSITSCNLNIELESNLNLTFEDLYSEEESTFPIKLLKNGEVIFIGHLKPDGIWEDLVNDRWILTIDAFDGLSTLKDLSFVKPNGLFFTGKISQLDAVYSLLVRTKLNLPINVSIDITYTGFNTNLNSILEGVYMNADRFYQDSSKDNIMNCEEVLKSILQIYNANIFQMNGEWFIVRNIDVKPSMTFKRYVDGVYQGVKTLQVNKTIGSHVNNSELFHVNSNQKKSIMPSIQTFRVGYKYGTVKSLLVNSELIFGNGFFIEGWEVPLNYSSTIIKINNGGLRVEGGFKEIILKSNQNIAVFNNDQLKLHLKYTNEILTSGIGFVLRTNNFYFENGVWKPGSVDYINEVRTSGVDWNNKPLEFNLDFTIPEDGNLSIKISSLLAGSNSVLTINRVELTPSSSNIKGEYHIAQRNSRISTVTKDNVTVSIGDSVSNVYYGTLYKDNGFSTSNIWKRVGVNENRELLDIMAEDNLRISPRPMKFIEGDVYGHIPYLSLISYDLAYGKYLPMTYSFSTVDNIVRLTSKEFNSDMISDFNIDKTYDYGNETKVNIRS